MSDDDLIARLLARIGELDSLEAIRSLTFDYCHGFDKRDYDRFMAIWWDDCVWDIGNPFGCFEGHSGIDRALHDILWPAWDETLHLCGNNRIAFLDPQHASSECDVQCVGRLAGDDEGTIVGASYSDQLQRRDGLWKIAKRKVTIHYFNSVPGLVLSKP